MQKSIYPGKVAAGVGEHRVQSSRAFQEMQQVAGCHVPGRRVAAQLPRARRVAALFSIGRAEATRSRSPFRVSRQRE